MIYDRLVRVIVGAFLVAGIVALAAPVAAQTLKGDGGDNKLRGSARADILNGRGGDDRLEGRGGKDRIRGGAGHDVIDGGGGADRIRAGRGSDLVVGGKGGDTISGGRGQDGINMEDGVEIASPGDDVIHAVDGERDEISCGEGDDTAYVDRLEDGVYDCETVIEPK